MTRSLLSARSGSQTPQVTSWPDYSATSGPDAVDLAAGAGLILDPWQAYVLEHGLGERPNGKWAATEVACIVPRQNGKGAIIEARVLAGLFLFGERMIVWTAHEYKTAQEGFYRIRNLIRRAPDFDALVKRYWEGSGEQGIELHNGQRLRFLARSKGSGRGFSGDLVILDESFALTAEQIEALMPTLSARPNPQIWYLSSPSLDAVSGSALMAVRKRGLAGDPGLAYFEWGAGAGADLDDRDVWHAANPALGIRISEESVERERAAMTDAGFARERLGIWPVEGDAEWQIIPKAPWQDAEDATAGRPTGAIAFAIEADLNRGEACIASASRRKGRGALRFTELVELRPGVKWVVPRVAELKKRWPDSVFVVYPGGPAGSLIPDLEAAGVEVIKPTTRDQAAAFGAMYDGIAGAAGDEPAHDIRHAGQGQLTAAVAGLRDRDVQDVTVWQREGLGWRAIAAALALWALTKSTPDDYDIAQSVY